MYSSNSINEVLKFTYPKLHHGKSWYVDFLSYDPATAKMRRKKYMLDSIPKITERRKRAAEIIEALTRQLRSGWSPWVNKTDNRGFILLSDALAKYAASVERVERAKTRKTYSSKLTILLEYINSRLLPPKYVYQFNASFISDFLDYVYLDRECSARTRNNYRGWLSAVAAFFMERQYISSNPVELIKNIPETAKKRQPLTPQMLRQLSAYLLEHDKMFLLACRMEYYTFIRPEELSHIRLRDISIKEQSVIVHADVSKNRRDGKVGLNESIIRLMLDLDIFCHSGDSYLFGARMKTCERKADSEQFRQRWLSIRKALNWGDEYQFYSLKDSGIRDLATTSGIVVARDQARHTDISTTNRYLKGEDLPVHNETKHFKGIL